MTNRRKSSKTKTSTSKKSESPDKQTRRISRRSRRTRISASPEEQPEEIGSEYSVDENTEDEGRVETQEIERDIDDSTLQGSDTYEIGGKSIDDQKLLLKEEESGGSDGSWKVKSENGGSGGIPKLKLCLTRPPDVSSPTSEQPSPRRRRRGKGNASPAPQEFQEALREDKDSPKRSTRSQKAKETAEQELTVEVKQTEMLQEEEEEEAVRSEVCDSTSANQSENEYEIQMAIDSITIQTPVQEVTEENLNQNQQIELEHKEDSVTFMEMEKEPERDEVDYMPCQEELEIPLAMEVDISDSPKYSNENMEMDNPEDSEDTKNDEVEMEKEPEKRPPSRDSSEERAKEEALRSRNKFKKAEKENVTLAESTTPENDKPTVSTEEEKSQLAEEDAKSDAKENQEESIPAKTNSRKRRWGASTNRVAKKPSVSISTDFLKEIIPEVKPLPMSEVQLSPNDEFEEGQVKDNEENPSVATKKVERGKAMPSDESEKDYEEEPVESGAEESPRDEYAKTPAHAKEKEFTAFTRKVSVLPTNDTNKIQRSPSPPRNKPSNILYIFNLVRPFTIPQLRELLARTGTITEDGFWIDKIKSRCYVKYETEEEAKATRHALHGVRWPVSNPKQLNVDFGTEAAMKAAQEGKEILPKRQIPSLFEKQIELKSGEKNSERDEKAREKKEKSERDKKELRTKQREEEKRDEEDKGKKVRPPVEPLVRDRTVRRVTVPVREWDVGKNEDGFSPPHEDVDYGRHRDERYDRRVEYERDKKDEYDERRRREKDKGRRSMSNEPPRKTKKKNEEEVPVKLLDDLFRKTKATPCIYWLPLTAEQIAMKEELRRKHMAEHEKRIAEMRKIQRDQNRRNSDKRRRRSKSRSRSRSPKK